MSILPRNPKPLEWKARRDRAEKSHGPVSYPQRQLVLHMAAQIRRETKAERKFNGTRS